MVLQETMVLPMVSIGLCFSQENQSIFPFSPHFLGTSENPSLSQSSLQVGSLWSVGFTGEPSDWIMG